jgi:protein O-mannosyl-transferase
MRPSPTNVTGAHRWQVPGLCLALTAMTFAVFGQTARHEFVNFDDNDYVYENAVVSQGLTLKGIEWAFSGSHSANWHPLTWLSHMLDCQIYGLHPAGHHLTSVLIHTAGVIALFLVLRQMTGALWRSAFVATVFAIHPLRVESVAWVAERKDVLSGLLFVLTVGAYVFYSRRPSSPGRYALVILLFALGLMCKPMLVTLPLVLLLLDYWPLRRAESPRKLVLEKLPLLALSAAGCVITLLAQRGAIQSTVSYSMPARVANAMVTGIVYLGQMVWPVKLAAFYPYPQNGLPPLKVALAALALASVSTLVIWRRRQQPWLWVGWFWYLIMLLPVIGIIKVGGQAHADRYTYLPQIGISVAVTWLAAEWHPNRVIGGGLMAGVLAGLMVCAWNQAAYWQDSATIWTRTIACTTDNDTAEYCLGNTLRQKGREDEAILHYRKALEIYPAYASAHYNLGNTLLQEGRLEDAIRQFQSTLQLTPDSAAAHLNLGIALFQEGRVDESIPHFQRAAEITPGDDKAHNDLGNALMEKGRLDEAISHFQNALQIKPDSAPAHLNLGLALFRKGRVDDAISYFRKALELTPAYPAAHCNLGDALLQKGEAAGAVSHYQKALQLEPANAQIQDHLAWVLATCSQGAVRDGGKAVQLAEQANQITRGESQRVLRTLAAAYAESGRFPEAVETAQRALRLAKSHLDTALAGQVEIEIKNYQTNTPFHTPVPAH